MVAAAGKAPGSAVFPRATPRHEATQSHFSDERYTIMSTAARIQRTLSQQAVIERAMAFDLSEVTRRYVRDFNLPADVAALRERELRRYLVLCALHRGAAYGMRGPVDELWHTFIFFTQSYHRFCTEIAGRYIHHQPHVAGASGDPRAYAKMLTAYELVFEEKPPAAVWPPLSRPAREEATEDAAGEAVAIAYLCDCKDPDL
jgi:hypothetical protein